MKHTVFITGAAGYVGAMLVKKFAARDDVERIIGLDKEPRPDFLRDIPNSTYLELNTADAWEEKVRPLNPTIVIHTAWQIRELYGKQDIEWKWNIEGSDKVFDFALREPSVKKLVSFSTVASYGAFPQNSLDHYFTEDEPFRKSDYRYAEEKRVAELHLKEKAESAHTDTQVVVIRPAAITGPRGRFMRIRFGLQAALSGQLRGSFVYSLISRLVAFVPITPKWARQFVHEDDVVNIVELLAFGSFKQSYEILTVCAPGETVRGKDMARAVGKRAILIPPLFVRFAFFWMWHLTRGRVPTGRGAWRSYSYPIVVDGSKVTREYGYVYKHSSFDAFYYTNGRYETFVSEKDRRTK